tara:strand:+ start:2429 stop:2974 length:546 start_codon:yes stop_codon:yes gene_type:complete
MGQAILFITETFIKNYSNIDDNVDTQYITPVIDLVQKMYIRPILGTALYNELVTQITDDAVSVNNVNLIENYIQDAMLYYVLSEGLPSFTYKIENKSVSTKTSDNATPVDNSIIQSEVARYKDRAEFFAQTLIDFLEANADDVNYNAYLNPGSAFNTVRPINNSYTTGWVLDDNDTKCTYE